MGWLAGAEVQIEKLDETEDLLAVIETADFVWSAEDRQIVASGIAARLDVGAGPDRISRAAAELSALFTGLDRNRGEDLPAGVAPMAVGSLPFSNDERGELIVPASTTVRLSDGRTWRITVESEPAEIGTEDPRGSLERPKQRLAGDGPDMTPAQWQAAVEEILRRIDAGGLQKVVLARTLTLDTDVEVQVGELIRHFREIAPTSYGYACDGLVGASPELLVSRRGKQIISRAMAGTSWKGWTPPQLGSEILVESDKDLREHQLVIDDVINDLVPWCESWQVKGPEMVRFSTVTHLVSTFTADLAAPFPGALALAGKLHPTAAVGGRPQDEALALIAKLEAVPRGRYAGPVGWVDAHGDGDFAIALRCAELGSGRIRLFAGAGIVAGSEPMKEWDETTAKLEPARRALGLS